LQGVDGAVRVAQLCNYLEDTKYDFCAKKRISSEPPLPPCPAGRRPTPGEQTLRRAIDITKELPQREEGHREHCGARCDQLQHRRAHPCDHRDRPRPAPLLIGLTTSLWFKWQHEAGGRILMTDEAQAHRNPFLDKVEER
jgi:hypothetical protein